MSRTRTQGLGESPARNNGINKNRLFEEDERFLAVLLIL